jgi:hypothetical protein
MNALGFKRTSPLSGDSPTFIQIKPTTLPNIL